MVDVLDGVGTGVCVDFAVAIVGACNDDDRFPIDMARFVCGSVELLVA